MSNSTESCAPFGKSDCSKQCFLRRLSQWLWSTWFIGSTEARSTISEVPSCHDDKNASYHVEDSEQSDASKRSSFPCKACQAWGVACDQQKPRCSHCLDQQILCFYVAPLPPLRATRRKRGPSTHTASLIASREIGASG
ncbi:hypothetical protein BDV25DRAFT_112915 [Aspergillus avenaceus]|uniref:Zn(2)-C6 fungal-type domain-containing protein n=1 Tax=Aspergillus avenaceus TaxID=36643 RepID=A0A5N6TVG5_ASPAV|nr:hypothetical protein BDV25DRAFT_112915 [Aspergillus avenaceus]